MGIISAIRKAKHTYTRAKWKYEKFRDDREEKQNRTLDKKIKRAKAVRKLKKKKELLKRMREENQGGSDESRYDFGMRGGDI